MLQLTYFNFIHYSSSSLALKATTTDLNPSDLPVVKSCFDKGYAGVRTKSMLQRPP
jgi:hypothetical protein